MIIPTITLNGTSKASLIEQRCRAASALEDALKELGNNCPHPRDFPSFDGDTLEQRLAAAMQSKTYRSARAEHQERVDAIRKIINDLREETIKIDEPARDKCSNQH